MNKSLFGLLLGGVLALFLLGSLLFAPALHAEGVDPKAAFETLKGLAGTWEGQGERSSSSASAVTWSKRTGRPYGRPPGRSD